MLQILEDESVRLILAMALSAPLSWKLRQLKGTTQRRIFSCIAGTLLQIFIYGIIPIVKISIFTVFIFALIKLNSHRCGSIVTVSAMVYLSYYHLQGLIYRYGQNVMDQGVLVMILVCKYSLFAYAYQDARDLTKKQQQNFIKQNVSFLQFFQYLQFLPTAAMGPPIQYRKFRQYIMQESPFEKIPSPKNALIENAKKFIGCGIIFAISFYIVPPAAMKQPQFMGYSAIYVGFYSIISISALRFKYYTAWKLGLFAVHASGVSYMQSKDCFKGINHCNVQIIQTSPHMRDKINNWNMSVQQWLRKCVFQRSPFKNKILSSLYVFMVSAFWHGYYIGYYFSFFMWFSLVYLQTKIFKYCSTGPENLRKLQKNPPQALRIAIVIIIGCTFSHNATFFYLLESQLCFKLMEKMFFLPQILPIIGIILFSILPPNKSTSKKEN